MSKNFEEEYRQMIDSELPDLWDRIEAQLPGVAAAPEVSERISSVSETSKTGNAGKGRRMWSVITAAAAAILCILAALPVLFLPRKDMSDSETNTAAQEDGAAAGGSMDTADTAADSGGDGYYENSEEPLPEPADAQYDAACMPEDADFMTETEMAEPTSDNADTQGVDGIAPTNGSQSGAEAAEAQLDLYQVEVRILDCIQGEQGETYYEAEVLQNTENDVKGETRLYFRCARDEEAKNDCTDVSFRQGETYVLCLYSSGETVEDYGVDDRNGDYLYEKEMYIVYEVIAKKK